MTRLLVPSDDVTDSDKGILRMLSLLPALAEAVRLLSRATRVSLGSERLREIAILCVAATTVADYEWGRHVVSARANGLSDEEIRAIRDGRFDEFEPEAQAAARFAEAVERRTVTDELWQTTAEHFTDEQMLELTALACQYGFVARLTLATDLELDADTLGLAHP